MLVMVPVLVRLLLLEVWRTEDMVRASGVQELGGERVGVAWARCMARAGCIAGK